MRTAVTLSLFAAGLLACIVFGASILYALSFGYVVFFVYGRLCGHSARSLLRMSWEGVCTVKNVLLTFILIGMLTAVWRQCGTIAFIIYYAGRVITPGAFLLTMFLLCCLVSFLTGTAFGTAATAGVICMTIANAMGIDPALAGGTILSGVFFGDRCSPMSTSALLVSELTETDIYRNIRAMLRSAAIPFALSCAVFAVLGLRGGNGGAAEDVWALFRENFDLHWSVVIPAALVLVLAACHVRVRVAMGVSVAAGSLLCLLVQRVSIETLLVSLVTGFHAQNEALGAMMNGGGLVSMVKVASIVCLSSSYAGIFKGTGLLTGLNGTIRRFSEHTSPYIAILATSCLCSMAACNQTLGIMLTNQLCGDLGVEKETMALHLEDTVVLVAALVPWSIAGVTPLATVGAPISGMAMAFYLYFVPLWRLIVDLAAHRQKARAHDFARGRENCL